MNSAPRWKGHSSHAVAPLQYDQSHYSRRARYVWPANYDVTWQIIHGSADSFPMKLGTPDVYFTISLNHWPQRHCHYSDVIMGTVASQITSLTIVYSTVYSGADQRKHQSSASLAFARGIHRWPVNSPHKRPVTRKMFPFDDVIMVIKKRP